MNRLRSPHTGAPCVRRRTCGAAFDNAVAAMPPQRDGGADRPPHGVWVLSSCGPRPQTFVLARGGSHVPRRGISRPRPWRKPRASCAELLFPAWDHAPHPRGTPAVQWFWKDNPPGRLAASSPLYTRGLVWRTPAAFRKQKTHPDGVGLNGADYEARTRFRFPERPAVRPGGPGPPWIQ